MPTAPAVDLVIAANIVMKGKKNEEVSRSSTSPIVKRMAMSMASPNVPFSRTVVIIDRGTTVGAFLTSSASFS